MDADNFLNYMLGLLYSQGIYDYAFNFIKNRHDTEDIIQETAIKILAKKDVLDRNAHEKQCIVYLRSCVRNNYLNICKIRKSPKHSPKHQTHDIEDTNIIKYTENDYINNVNHSFSDVMLDILGLIKKINPSDVFLERTIYKTKYKQLSKEIGINSSTARVQYFSTRNKVRKYIKENNLQFD